MTPPSVWHPLRSDPALGAQLTFGSHVLSIVGAILATLALGLLLGVLGVAVSSLDPAIGGGFAALGMVMMFSVLFTWAGHIPGSLLLHAAVKQGFAGWGTAALAGLLVGAALGVLGSELTAVLGPVLAVIQLALLRWLLRRGAGRAA